MIMMMMMTMTMTMMMTITLRGPFGSCPGFPSMHRLKPLNGAPKHQRQDQIIGQKSGGDCAFPQRHIIWINYATLL
jgi:hypothetical protein